MNSTLEGIIPARQRKLAYKVASVVGIVIGVLNIVYTTTDPTAVPVWVTVLANIALALGLPGLGTVANANVTPDHPVRSQETTETL